MAGYDIRITNGDISVGDSAADMARSGDLFGVVDGYFRPVGEFSRYSTSAKALLDWYGKAEERPLEGSYSAVVFDQSNNSATLISDRFGTRPLYYVARDGYLHASTRLTNLVNEPDSLKVSSDALSDSMALGFVRAPDTLISATSRVPRNARVTIELANGVEECERLPDPLINRGQRNGTLEGLTGQVRKALEEECSQLAEQAESVALLLSGGIDSSILAAVASCTFSRCVAFSCEIEGFDNPELERAKYVANSLGIEHRIVKLQSSEIPELFREMVSATEGPSRHINNLVTLRLFQDIKGFDAIIGGDAADALFGSGNQRTVINLEKKQRALRKVPSLVRNISALALRAFRNRKLIQLRKLLTKDLDCLTRQLFVIEYPPAENKLAAKMGLSSVESIAGTPKGSDSSVSRSIEANFELFLNSMLMRNSQLSATTGAYLFYPFLTDQMIAISKQVPDSLRFDNQGNAKPVLRALCDDLLGPAVTGWPKIGFVTPEKRWLDNELSEQATRLYSNSGGIRRVLGHQFDAEDIETLKGSTRMLWWLITLDESLLRLDESRDSAK